MPRKKKEKTCDCNRVATEVARTKMLRRMVRDHAHHVEEYLRLRDVMNQMKGRRDYTDIVLSRIEDGDVMHKGTYADDSTL